MADTSLPRGWDGYEREQVLWIIKHTTPEQRFLWLCDTLDLLGDRLSKRIEVRDLCEAWNRRHEVTEE